MKSFSDSYKAAGVDVTAGYKAVELMKSHVAKTMNANVLSGLGGFGGLFAPVCLVSKSRSWFPVRTVLVPN